MSSNTATTADTASRADHVPRDDDDKAFFISYFGTDPNDGSSVLLCDPIGLSKEQLSTILSEPSSTMRDATAFHLARNENGPLGDYPEGSLPTLKVTKHLVESSNPNEAREFMRVSTTYNFPQWGGEEIAHWASQRSIASTIQKMADNGIQCGTYVIDVKRRDGLPFGDSL
jgi:hypothetical protein